MYREQIVYSDGVLCIMNPDAKFVSTIRVPMSKASSKSLINHMARLVNTSKCLVKPVPKIGEDVTETDESYLTDCGYMLIGTFNDVSLYVGKLDVRELDVVIVHAVSNGRSTKQIIISPKIHGYDSNEEYMMSLESVS